MKYILTFDYELFGSGKGCIRKKLIEPTNKILNILKKNDVRATFFVEQLEIEAILREGEKAGEGSNLYNEALLLKEQILEMVALGHDVQLHLHPQWYGAKHESGKWILNFAWWRFSSLPYNDQPDGTPGRYDLLYRGKEYLEKIIRPFKPDYRCIAFRAGGYNIGVDEISYQALKQNGFRMESSVCPGFYENSSLSQYDYTNITDFNHYPFYKDDGSIIEYPLITMASLLIERISCARVYAKFINKQNKRVNYSGLPNKNSTPYLLKNIKNTNFDVCLSSKKQLIDFNKVIDESKLEYVVLIGHSKDYSFFSPLNNILKQKNNSYITFADIE